MSYRIEPTSKTTQDIVIDGWEKGISAGPYQIFVPSALGPITQTGMVDLSYGNIVGIPGEFSVQFPLTASTVTGATMDIPNQVATQIDNSAGGTVTGYFQLDDKGQVFSAGVSGGAITWTYMATLGSGLSVTGDKGCCYWQGNVFVWVGSHIWYSPEGTGYAITATGAISSGATSATLTSNWPLASGTQVVTFSDGETKTVTFTNASTSITWTGGLVNTVTAALNILFVDWTATVDPSSLLVAGNQHYAISSKVADSMYFCNGNHVGQLQLNLGQTFNPTNPSTYVFQANQVAIPAYDECTCLAEINGSVLIGGALNRVYPWDAQNLSGSGVTSLVGLPLFLGDRYVQRIVVVNANAYIFAGHPVIPTGRGYIYISNGSTIDVFQKMPDNFVTIAGASSTVQTPYWRFGDAIWHRNQLLFSAVAIGNISGTTISDTGGIWAIDINSNALYRANEMTGGNTTLATVINPLDVGTTIPGVGYFCGSSGSMNGPTDTLGTTARIISDKIPAGTFLSKGTYEQIEVKLAVPMVTGESVAITAITDLGSTSIGTMTSTDGVGRVFTPIANQQNLQWIQLQAVLTPTNTNPTFCRLRELRIR